MSIQSTCPNWSSIFHNIQFNANISNTLGNTKRNYHAITKIINFIAETAM